MSLIVLKNGVVCVAFLCLNACSEKTQDEPSKGIESEQIEGVVDTTRSVLPLPEPYFGLKPQSIPQIMQAGFITSNLEEYNGSFSPDGKAFYYSTDVNNRGFISYTKLESDGWTIPRIAPFSGVHSEYDPIFSPDGKRLYFSSERPTDSSENLTNIYFVEVNDNGLSDPQLIELTGNGDYFSSLTNQGDIYFNVWNEGDMFKASPVEGGFDIEKLTVQVNSENGEGDPFIDPEERFLIFRRQENYSGDLFISFNVDGVWTEAERLPEPINSSRHEMCPFVSGDGKMFVFASSRVVKGIKTEPNSTLTHLVDQKASYDNGSLNIYYMSADFIFEMMEKHAK